MEIILKLYCVDKIVKYCSADQNKKLWLKMKFLRSKVDQPYLKIVVIVKRIAENGEAIDSKKILQFYPEKLEAVAAKGWPYQPNNI